MNLSLQTPCVDSVIQSYCQQERLPDTYPAIVEQWFLPLLDDIRELLAQQSASVVVGISGCQGSGKSTLADLLVALCEEALGLRAVSLSIDDFYLPLADRQTLAREVHPLLVTRGVPGTHDVGLAIDTIQALSTAAMVSVPRFDKAVDDRVPDSEWSRVQGPVDIIILEGWCVGIGAQQDSVLEMPINALETNEDQQGRWRRYVNQALREHYLALYDLIDFLVMLRAPGFDKVFEWRQRQEQKLATRLREAGQSLQESRVMTAAEVRRFIQHYERLTRHGLETLPARADVVFQLDADQHIIAGDHKRNINNP